MAKQPPPRRTVAPPSGLDALGQAPVQRPGLVKAPAQDPVLGVATASPPAPPQQQQAEPPPPARRTGPVAVPTATVPPPAPAKTKVGFYQDPDDTARARAAFKWNNATLGYKSFSDFIAGALMKEVERLEREYNGGQPWGDVAPGEMPTGRPLGT